MAKQGKKTPGSQGAKKQQHPSSTLTWKPIRKNLKKQQTLTWKPISEKTHTFLRSLLDSTELALLSENHHFINDNKTEAIQHLTQLKKRIMRKLKSVYTPEAKWQSINTQNCIEWLEKMREKDELLVKASEEEEREVEELEEEMENLEERN